jgi:hypothetical protein
LRLTRKRFGLALESAAEGLIGGDVIGKGIEFRLGVMNFMQCFVWGSWLISFGAYMIVTLGFTGGQSAASTRRWASVRF